MDDHREKRLPPVRGAQAATRLDRPAPVGLAVAGDPVVGRALALLLHGSRYDTRFLDDQSLRQPGALEGVRLVLLTPGVSPRWPEAPSAIDGDAQISVLRLLASSKLRREGEEPTDSGRAVPWPCSIEELKRRIETALVPGAGPGGTLPTETR